MASSLRIISLYLSVHQVIFVDQHGHEVAHNPSKLEVKHVGRAGEA